MTGNGLGSPGSERVDGCPRVGHVNAGFVEWSNCRGVCVRKKAKILLVVVTLIALAVVGAVMWRDAAWTGDYAVMWRDFARVIYAAVFSSGLGAV